MYFIYFFDDCTQSVLKTENTGYAARRETYDASGSLSLQSASSAPALAQEEICQNI